MNQCAQPIRCDLLGEHFKRVMGREITDAERREYRRRNTERDVSCVPKSEVGHADRHDLTRQVSDLAMRVGGTESELRQQGEDITVIQDILARDTKEGRQ